MKTYKFYTYTHSGDETVEVINAETMDSAQDIFEDIYGSNWYIDSAIEVEAA
jgi:hypothetical protein